MVTSLQQNGKFVISLDFELYWGVRDIMTIESYKENLLGVRKAIPHMLKLFQDYGIHATWATVGFLFLDKRDELKKWIPEIIPDYMNELLNPYPYIDNIGENEDEDPFHYGRSLVEEIKTYPNQEIGTHTFSHYYGLEEGQSIESFKEDLRAALDIGRDADTHIESLVFPRNQMNPSYFSLCRDLGITCFRGNEQSWIYRPSSRKDESLLKRAVRLLDAYVNISGHNCYPIDYFMTQNLPINIPSSRFLRPYNPKLHLFENLRLNRILKGLTYAAEHNQVYHLWWHPHNFGAHLEENLAFLRKILDHFQLLKGQYNMQSRNMRELANDVWHSKSSQ